MKNIHNYIMLFIVAFAVASCTDDEVVSKKVLGQTGDDVQFGLSLKNSRTVYGDGNVDEDDQVVSYPIYWVDGDKVFVFSPECLDGRRGAEYKVILPDEGNAYYAKDLEKTGDFGVQWGEADQAVFYSLYPSGAYGLSDDGTIAKGIVVNYSQNIIVDGENIKSDMEDCLLYAKADGGEENDWMGVPKGEVVNLQYNPITTVFRIKLNVPSTSADDFTIQSVSITAPNGVDIAGKFGIYVEDGTFAEWGENKARTVSAAISDKNTGEFYTIKKGNSLEIPLFLAPVDGLNTKDWKIEVKANNKSYIKTLDSQDVVAGQIHHVTLPDLSTKQVVEWDVATWMKNIPRNVYLSEVSIPGSWNSINNDFQTMGETDAKTIENQYKKGVRAFHLDTRWKAKYGGILGFFQSVVGLGVADGGSTGDQYNQHVETQSANKYMSDSNNPLVEDIIAQLVSYIKTTPDEYMVLLCSFAQGSAEHNGANGWMKEISSICAKDAYKDYILNAQDVDSGTLVGHALGKILVIMATSGTITSATTPSSDLAENSSCFFSYLPMELKESQFAETATNSDELWYTTTTTNDSGITLYNSHAQMTSSTGSPITNHSRGYVPSDSQREALLNKITKWSRENYGKVDYQHNKWIYLGLGGGYVAGGGNTGITSGSYSTLAAKYNTWINGKVTEMGTKPEGSSAKVPFYPVGIVLMNKVEDHAETVKNILLLNNRYRLQYDPTKPEVYDPNYYLPGSGDGGDNEEGGDGI